MADTRRTIHIPDEAWAHLREEAWKSRKSVSELIRERTLQDPKPSTGNHHHFEAQGGVASDAERLRSAARAEAEQKDSKVSGVSPKLDAGFAGLKEAVDRMFAAGKTPPKFYYDFLASDEYKAWEAQK